VTLTATEYNFDLSATPSSDTKTIAFKNDGKELHELIFAKINKGFTVDQAYQLQGRKGSAEIVGQAGAKPGQAQKVTLKQPLAPGHYAMICPLQTKGGKPHYKLGQLQEFDVD
jgi:hypothetical protein